MQKQTHENIMSDKLISIVQSILYIWCSKMTVKIENEKLEYKIK